MICGLRHVGIVVNDLDVMLAFYVELLGCTVRVRMDERGEHIDKMLGLKRVLLRTVKLDVPGGGIIELLKFDNPEGEMENLRIPNDAGISHLAFTVDHLDQMFGWLLSAGVEFVSEPVKSGACRVVFMLDPEQNLLELTEPLQ